LVSRVWEDCANFTPTTNTAPTALSAIQAASQSTFINAQFTPLVISGNEKNKQITLLTQGKLALTGRNLNGYVNSEGFLLKKPGPTLI
jgi:hypothetical protein